PPLRERPEDIKLLADHFAEKFAEMNAVTHRPVSDAALAHLRAHRWQGNVRELENTMHRAVLLASGDAIGPEAIILTSEDGLPISLNESEDALSPPSAGRETAGTTLVGQTVAAVERDLIIDTLSHCLGNRTHAANILGISIRTLRNKLNQYQDEGVPVPAPGEGRAASTGGVGGLPGAYATNTQDVAR
ncbi:MAG: helix-turn-helix domain-containing protein, partial [Pseudomonadota bacterium]